MNKPTADTITAASVLEVRKALASAAGDAFMLQVRIERGEVTPEQAAAELADILQPLQIEKP